MRKSHADLPRYTWDQCAILNIWPASAYAKLKIKPATIRARAARAAKNDNEDGLKPVGIGPNGCVLYRYEDIFPET